MIPRLLAALRRRPAVEARPRPSGPPGAALYAIGDIHGHSQLLERLLEPARREAAAGKTVMVVGLGDYVDRGPDTPGVVDRLLDIAHAPNVEARFLRGNHDQLLLDFLADHSMGPYWQRVGGHETLQSYGVEPPDSRGHMDAWREARDLFAANLPPAHLEFYRGLNFSFIWGDYFFAHAGAQPGIPLEQQTAQDLMWIRKVFLEDDRPFDRIVVHGHTPAEEAHADHRRIGLDTGAYMTGVLSACRFEGSERLLVQAVERQGAPPELRSRPL
jgi:serine/threonine protein phosphatase 1